MVYRWWKQYPDNKNPFANITKQERELMNLKESRNHQVGEWIDKIATHKRRK